MRQWIMGNLKRGDQARIAELAGTSRGYVKAILRYRDTAKSVKSQLIWIKAYRYLKLREEMLEDATTEQPTPIAG